MNFKLKKRKVYVDFIARIVIFVLAIINLYFFSGLTRYIGDISLVIISISCLLLIFTAILRLKKSLIIDVLRLKLNSLVYCKFKDEIVKNEINKIELVHNLFNSYALVFPKIEISVKWYQLKKKRLLKKYGTDLFINLDELEGEEKENFELINKWLTND